MAYFSSFDLRHIGVSSLTLSTSGHSDISVNLSTFAYPNAYSGLTQNVTVFNHVAASDWPGLGPYSEFPLTGIPSDGLLDALKSRFQSLATSASWSSPSSINISINTNTWLVTFAYSGSLTAVTFGNTETRRLFGFGGDFSGSSTSITGSDVPKYIIVPDVDGASSATPVMEEGDVSSAAYSGAGRGYSLSRSTNRRSRKWVQQYETKGRTFRKFALTIPNEFTWQDLFENCRAGHPFAVYGGFGENVYEAYIFRNGSEAFHAVPATPGNANQFHIPFDAYAVGRN